MNPSPARYAVIGNPVAHSRSPQIHAAFARQTGDVMVYERRLAPLDGFRESVTAFFDEGGCGLNVTVPFKQQAWQLAQAHLSERARLAGAVNTLWRDQGVLRGCNTDGVGLLRDLAHCGVSLAGARVLLVGAGGAARGVIAPLLAAGCAELRVVNRTAARAHELVADLQSALGSRSLQAAGLADAGRSGGWDVVINATASSLDDAAPDLPPTGIWRVGGWAYDMMYGSQPTPFLRQAAAAGMAVADGMGMLVEQAAESFRLWRGILPDTTPVRQALRAALANQLPADAPLSV